MDITQKLKQSWADIQPSVIAIPSPLPHCPEVPLNGITYYEEVSAEQHITSSHLKEVYECGYEDDEKRKWVYEGSLACNPDSIYKQLFIDYYKPLHPETYEG